MGPCMCGDALCHSCNPGAAEYEAFGEALDAEFENLPESISREWMVAYIAEHAESLFKLLSSRYGRQDDGGYSEP